MLLLFLGIAMGICVAVLVGCLCALASSGLSGAGCAQDLCADSLRDMLEILLSNQETVDAYAARVDAVAESTLAATAANVAAVDALRAEVAAGSVEVPVDVTAFDAAVAKAEAAAAAAVVPAPVEAA